MQCLLDRRLTHIALLVMVFAFITVVGGNYLRPSSVTTSCCRSVSSKKVPFTITHYRIQKALKPCIAAVIFYTKEKGAICAHPKAYWVRKKIREINSPAHHAKKIK
ncbi:eotaxin isoform X1 [Callorhinchus milii]|nr:eotaxin isoform X1 [Callorhinchus milii]